MDKSSFNDGVQKLQMAFREAIESQALRFWFEFINEKAGPSNEQWLRAVEQIIVGKHHRLPPLGQVLMEVQAIQAEDYSAMEIKERKKESELMEAEIDDVTRWRIRKHFIEPLVKKLGAWEGKS